MSEINGVSPGFRATIKEHLRSFFQNWIKNGAFLKTLMAKTKNGLTKLQPRHIRDTLADLYHRSKNAIVNFVKKILTAPLNFARMVVSMMISEFISDPALQRKLMAKFSSRGMVKG